MAVLSQTIGQEIADALGISMKGITGIKIELKTNEVVSVDVSYYPGIENMNSCLDILKRYQLADRVSPGAEKCIPKFGNISGFTGMPSIPGWRERIDRNVTAAREAIELQGQHALERILGCQLIETVFLGRQRHYGPRSA